MQLVNTIYFSSAISSNDTVDDSITIVAHLHMSTVACPASAVFFPVHSMMVL